MKEKFNTGRKFFNTSVSRPGFFRGGLMIADFNSDGKTPVAKEEFTRSAITGARTGSRSCKRLVGIGSRIQVALEDFVTISVISKAFVDLKHVTVI